MRDTTLILSVGLLGLCLLVAGMAVVAAGDGRTGSAMLVTALATVSFAQYRREHRYRRSEREE